MSASFRCALMLVLVVGGTWAQEVSPAFALVDEVAKKIETRCFYPVRPGAIYEGVLASAHKRSGDENAPDYGLRGLPAEAASAGFRVALQTLAERPGQRLDIMELAETSLSDFCRTIDSWSRYYSMEDTARLEQFRKADSVGIGVNLREEGGFVFCHPFPESQAGLAGMTSGDKLLSVDGRSVDGRSLELVAAWIKGVPGTQTKLRVEKQTGRTQLVTVLREAGKWPSVIVEKALTGTVTKIRFFEKDTAGLMTEALKAQPAGRRLTLDLRGCIGGSMHAAIEVARLLVPPGQRILSHVERGAEREDFISTGPSLTPGSIAILQDKGTASAAEILIAALVETMPKQVISRGEQSHGKGVVQEEFKLSGGGLLRLTTGMVFGPSGRSWDGPGLRPSFSPDGPVDIFSPNAPTLPGDGAAK